MRALAATTFAILAAFCTAVGAAEQALPFTPPDGWEDVTKDVPQPEILAAWKGPRTGFSEQTVHIVSAPFDADVEAMVGKMLLTDTGALGMRVISQRSGMLCNEPARFLVLTKHVQGGQMQIEQSMFVTGGRNYLITYGHDVTQNADPDIRQILDAICPGTVAAASTALPPSWEDVTLQNAHVDGSWSGKARGQTMDLVSQPYSGALENLSMTALAETASTKAAVEIVASHPGSLCGLPAYFLSARVRLANLKVLIQQEAVRANGRAYILTYGRLQEQPDDPAALRSMKTLCPKSAAS